MYLKRDIDNKLLDWKKWRSKSGLKKTMLVRGGRQIGKTTTIEKFCVENYRSVYKIDCSDSERRLRLEESLSTADVSIIAEKITGFFKQYEVDFRDTEDSILFIDEIQDSRYTYEKIRVLTRGLTCDVIVTGSYLNEALKYFQPFGDLAEIRMHTVSFIEFMNAIDSGWNLERFREFTWEDLDKLNQFYLAYCLVGGYPDAVVSFLNGNSIEEVALVKQELFSRLISEIKSRLGDSSEVMFIEGFLVSLVKMLINEKRGGLSIEHLTKEIKEADKSLNLTKKESARVIRWLTEAGWLSFCSKVDLKTGSISSNERCYFEDLGMLSLLVGADWFDDSDYRGFFAENFVFKILNESLEDDASSYLGFGVLDQFEIDFCIRIGKHEILAEVKSGNSQGISMKNISKKTRNSDMVYLREKSLYHNDDDFEVIPLVATEVWFKEKRLSIKKQQEEILKKQGVNSIEQLRLSGAFHK